MNAHPTQRQRITELHAKGMAPKEIAAVIGCTVVTVRARLWENRQPKQNSAIRLWTERELQTVRERWIAGDHVRDIADEVGCKPAAVYYRANRLGLPTRRAPIGGGALVRLPELPLPPARAAAEQNHSTTLYLSRHGSTSNSALREIHEAAIARRNRLGIGQKLLSAPQRIDAGEA